MAWPLRRFLRLTWLILCILCFLALPVTIYDFSSRDYNIHFQAWFIGGIFTIMSVPITIYEVAMHIEHYTRPRLQRHVIRILWMVPIYGIDAWFALRFRGAREYLDPIRECYEAFVIYSFFSYLMAYLEEELGDVEEYLSRKPPMQHMFPFRLVVKPWAMGSEFLWECKKGILNYVVVRPLTTSLALITGAFNKYGQGQLDFHHSYIYLATITNFSQMWALYCLLLMYAKLHKELAPIRPVSKFIVVKAVIFVTFWQGITIAILVYTGVISGHSWSTYKQLDVATGIQDFLICIEMFVAALAHAHAFPPRDYMEGHPEKGFLANVRHMFDVRDVVDGMYQVVEEHATTVVDTASTVVDTGMRLPHSAVRKATRGFAVASRAPQSIFSFLNGGGKKASPPSGPDDEDLTRHALLTNEERGEAVGLLMRESSSVGGSRGDAESGSGGYIPIQPSVASQGRGETMGLLMQESPGGSSSKGDAASGAGGYVPTQPPPSQELTTRMSSCQDLEALERKSD